MSLPDDKMAIVTTMTTPTSAWTKCHCVMGKRLGPITSALCFRVYTIYLIHPVVQSQVGLGHGHGPGWPAHAHQHGLQTYPAAGYRTDSRI